MNLSAADHAGDDGPGVDPDPDRELEPERLAQAPAISACMSRAISAIASAWSGARLGQPADDHVGVADRLDLLEPVPLGERVEGAEDLVEHADDALRGGRSRTA